MLPLPPPPQPRRSMTPQPRHYRLLAKISDGILGNPSAGFVYFLYRGKLKKLKKLVLRLQVGQATCVLKIRG